MSGAGPCGAEVLLLELSERTSAKGNRWWSGWLGKAAVVGFPGEPDKHGHPTIAVYVQTPEPKPEDRVTATAEEPRPRSDCPSAA